MAKINGIDMTDEQFMLITELGTIIHDEGYDFSSGDELDISKLKSDRAKQIIAKLEQMGN